MSTTTEYFSMQGRVALGLVNADGSRKPAQWVYDAAKLDWALSAEKDEINEHFSGGRGVGATLQKKRSMKVNLTLSQLNDSNAAIAIAGTTVQVTGGSVTNESIGDVAVGDMMALEYAKVSALVLTGTAPTALVLDTDYTVNANTGVLTFLTVCTGVKAAYTYDAFSLITAFSGNRPDMYLLFDGQNTVDGATGKVRGEVYRVSLDPASTVSLIQDEFGSLDLTGDAKVDANRLSDDKYGGYARLMLIDPA